ncbi:hypothetical protein [Plantactinospora sp. B24E8]|uniref:hypothetical protein n=1 Tax=Plantactinospora sp. B24E8 TaxID=3153567 RepID=UPI00325F0303
MRDIHDLRHALNAETTDVAVHISPDLVRRRAHRIRTWRRTVAAAAVIAVAAGTVSTVRLVNAATPGFDVAGPPSSGTSLCPSPPDGPTSEMDALGTLVETGAVLDVPSRNLRYDVLIGLTWTIDEPGFAVAFRDQQAGTVEVWDTTLEVRDPSGDLAGKRADDPPRQFLSSQLELGPNTVLDVGLYTRTAHRITVASEGAATDAETSRNAATGWTLFWAQRRATPLPPERHTVSGFYEGPEQVTLTAYDAVGQPQHTVTGGLGVGGSVQNPRDGSAGPADPTSSPTTPTATCPSPDDAPR